MERNPICEKGAPQETWHRHNLGSWTCTAWTSGLKEKSYFQRKHFNKIFLSPTLLLVSISYI